MFVAFDRRYSMAVDEEQNFNGEFKARYLAFVNTLCLPNMKDGAWTSYQLRSPVFLCLSLARKGPHFFELTNIVQNLVILATD